MQGIEFKNLENYKDFPDSNVHGANMGPTWVLSAPDGPHVGPNEAAYQGCPVH